MSDPQSTNEPGQNLPARDQAPQTSATPRERALARDWHRRVDTYGGVEWWTGTHDGDDLVCWDRMDRATSADCRWAVAVPGTGRLRFERDEDAALTVALSVWS